MSAMKILLIEDEEDQREAFKEAVEVFNDDENNQGVEPDTAANLSEASNKIDGSYDGVIIDLVLGNDADGGNKIVRQLGDSFTRIPIIFVTAFPEDVVDHPSIIHTRRRSDGIYTSDLLLFQKIYDTGLTRIMGGRGLIEQRLNDVFLKNLLPQINTWISYAETDSERTEKALLRYALNHLIQFLEEDEKLCFPEEFYLYPSVLDRITTGSIVTADDQWFVVLSPACDLVPRGENGVLNTDHILLVEIESVEKILGGSKSKNRVSELSANRRTYYHWLPPTDFFQGGILNFRRLTTLDQDVFDGKFGKPTIQISPSFVKDIVSRFSSYYARQGQPDIDNKDFIDRYTT
ncbi:response regulator [Candidatus Poribacteria bacterium]|nr:response regulator [Candidatus Poribacteria bacterium]MYA54839.1 response regulator [Candidatus Poribacteria bacterium]